MTTRRNFLAFLAALVPAASLARLERELPQEDLPAGVTVTVGELVDGNYVAYTERQSLGKITGAGNDASINFGMFTKPCRITHLEIRGLLHPTGVLVVPLTATKTVCVGDCVSFMPGSISLH